MLNRSTTWAVVFLAATFAAGIAVGAGCRALWVRYASAAAPDRARGGGGGGLDRMMDELNEELRLGAGQRDSVRAIVQRHRTRMTAAWETVRPRFDSMRAQMDSEVARQLTPEQQVKYRDHVTRYRHQKEQEKTDTGAGGRKK
jgi:Spy/CpxP family protein refolding chaperone